MIKQKFMKEVNEFKTKLENLLKDYENIATIYAANVVIESWEVIPVIKIKPLINIEENKDKDVKEDKVVEWEIVE